MDEQDRYELLFTEIGRFLNPQREGAEVQKSDSDPANPSLEPPTPVNQKVEFTTTARVVGHAYTVPLSVICITGGIAMLNGLEQAKEIIAQNPDLFRNSILLPESLAVAGVIGIAAGSIFVASAAIDTARGLNRIYRHFRPAG